MNVSIFGLGYVGVVSTACFARDGINVIGVDISESKIRNINNGISPIIESGLNDLLNAGLKAGRIFATTDIKYAVKNTGAKSPRSFGSGSTPRNDKESGR